MHLSARVLGLLGLLAGAAAGGCGGQPPPAAQAPAASCKPQSVQLTVIASPRINRSDDGQARPVQLRIYQLKTDSRVLNASFDDLWKDDKGTLKDDLVKVDELSVYPDTRVEAKFERDDSVHFIVPVALFRNPKGRTWWTEFELAQPGKGVCLPENTHLAVWIDQVRVTDGADHLDEYPTGAPLRELHLRFEPQAGAPANGAPAPPPPAPPEGSPPQ